MKVACISVFKDGTGYAHAATRQALALDAVGVDVVCRSIHLTPHTIQLSDKMEELHCKDLNDVDVAIQYILPHMFHANSKVKNIGAFCWETTNFKYSSWSNKCKLMDELWTTCGQARKAINDSGVSKPTFVFPVPQPELSDNIEHLKISEADGKCVFYTIAELSKRKNIESLLRAYFLAFTKRDNAVLVVKTYKGGESAESVKQKIKTTIEYIKVHSKLGPAANYPPVIVDSMYWTEDRIKQLHVLGDVFCTASRGESWAIPAADAMSFGNPAIVPAWGSFPDLMCEENSFQQNVDTNLFDISKQPSCGRLIPGRLVPVFGQEGFVDLYTSREDWFEVDIRFYADQMKDMFIEWQNTNLWNTTHACKRNMERFSFENVGNKMKKRLEALLS